MGAARRYDGPVGFQTELDVRFKLVDEPRHWLLRLFPGSARVRFVLLRDLVWIGALGDRVVVPKGFESDFASVPWFLRWLVSVVGSHARAAVVHDWLYESALVGRYDADGIFRRIMREDRTSAWRRWIAWAGVSVGGWVSWNRARRGDRRQDRAGG